ncbi:MAG: mechanosensitive ion channel family protein [Chloroflexaceae bacterium]
MTLSFAPALEQLETLLNEIIMLLPNLVVAVIVFVACYFLARATRILAQKLSDNAGRQRSLGIVLGRLSQATVTLLGLLIALVIIFPEFSPAQLVQLLGISSVAIGFAFRDILQNFLAGILLLLTEPFRIGDEVVVNEYEGTVEDIQTRATTIMTYDGRRVVIPNADLFTHTVTVNTAFDKRRVEYDIGIGYGDDIEQAKQLILGILGRLENVLQTPAPDVLVFGLADYSVTLRVRWWIKQPTRAETLDSRDHVLSAIKQTLLAHGIDLPFPTQQILFHDQTEETDGDRTRQREGWPAGKGMVPQPRTNGHLAHTQAELQPQTTSIS